MIAQIICDTIMFSVYSATIVFTAYNLIALPKRLSLFAEKDNDLSQIEATQTCQKVYVRRYFVLLLFHVCALAVDGVMCLFDGLSDTENGLIVPVWVFLSLSLALTLLFTVYSNRIRKKYKMVTSPTNNTLGNWRTNSPVDLMIGILIAFLFAFHSAIVAYTIRLLFI